jgi:DnaJ family protein A protein 2
MSAGDRIVCVGMCSDSPQFRQPGDLILVLQNAGDAAEIWGRKETTLNREVTISLAEALLGWERRFDDHPSGKPLHIVWSGGSLAHDEILRIPGWGMPHRKGEEKGDLRIRCKIQNEPCTWSEEQLRALREVWPGWVAPVGGDDTQTPVRLV